MARALALANVPPSSTHLEAHSAEEDGVYPHEQRDHGRLLGPHVVTVTLLGQQHDGEEQAAVEKRREGVHPDEQQEEPVLEDVQQALGEGRLVHADDHGCLPVGTGHADVDPAGGCAQPTRVGHMIIWRPIQPQHILPHACPHPPLTRMAASWMTVSYAGEEEEEEVVGGGRPARRGETTYVT